MTRTYKIRVEVEYEGAKTSRECHMRGPDYLPEAIANAALTASKENLAMWRGLTVCEEESPQVAPACPVCKGHGKVCTYCGAPPGECLAPLEHCTHCHGEG